MKTLTELEKILSVSKVQELSKIFGGQTFHLVKNPSSNALYNFLGAELYSKLYEQSKVCQIYIRTSLTEKQKAQRLQINALLATGKSTSQVATIMECSARWVRKVRELTKNDPKSIGSTIVGAQAI